MLTKIKQLFLGLIDNKNNLSSKRFAGLTIVFSAICLSVVATIKSHGICPIEMFNSLLILASGCFGFNMAENILKKPVSPDAESTKIDTPDAG